MLEGLGSMIGGVGAGSAGAGVGDLGGMLSQILQTGGTGGAGGLGIDSLINNPFSLVGNGGQSAEKTEVIANPQTPVVGEAGNNTSVGATGSTRGNYDGQQEFYKRLGDAIMMRGQ